MKRILGTAVVLAVVAMMSSPAVAGLTDIAVWTFETSIPTTAGPHEAEEGPNAGAGSLAKAVNQSSSSVYSNPVGNGSPESFSVNNWTVGDYWQFCTSTEGYFNIAVNWDQISSNTGPRDFTLQYSVNGKDGPFEDVVGFVVLGANPSWSSLPENFRPQNRYKEDLSAFEELNDASDVCFRLFLESDVSATGGTIAGSGTNRVDNLRVKGLVIPEPGTIGLLALGALFLRRRR